MLLGRGQSLVVIDKNVANLSCIADRHYIIERGRTCGAPASSYRRADLQH
jgi:branched-chain amino acid transport system ATP-binding protein